jgi:hypothetical protein
MRLTGKLTKWDWEYFGVGNVCLWFASGPALAAIELSASSVNGPAECPCTSNKWLTDISREGITHEPYFTHLLCVKHSTYRWDIRLLFMFVRYQSRTYLRCQLKADSVVVRTSTFACRACNSSYLYFTCWLVTLIPGGARKRWIDGNYLVWMA